MGRIRCAATFGLISACFASPASACLGTQFESNAITANAPDHVPAGTVVLYVSLITDQDHDRLSSGQPAEARILRGPLRDRRVKLTPERWTSCDRAGVRQGFVIGHITLRRGKLAMLTPITQRNTLP
jgi:hypothetical protein